MSISPSEEIQVTLPSNVSREVFKNNQPANYRTKLRAPLELAGQWEVALVDIQYPHKWNNFRRQCNLYFQLLTIQEVIAMHKVQPSSTSPDVLSTSGTSEATNTGSTATSVSLDNQMGEKEEESVPSVETIEENSKPAAETEKPEANHEEDPIPVDIQEDAPSSNTVAEAAVSRPDSMEIPKEPIAPEKPATMYEVCKKLNRENPKVYGEHLFQFSISKGYYNTFEDLGKYIAAKFNVLTSKMANVKLTFQYDNFEKTAEFKVSGCKCILFSEDDYLMSHLGYIAGKQNYKKQLGRDYVEYDLSGGPGTREPFLDDMTTIYVSTDLVEYQLVGNTQVPLMGVFPIQGEHGKQLYWSFNPPYYIPVTKYLVPDIEILLSTATGETVEILEGDVISRLHFRKRFLSRTI